MALMPKRVKHRKSQRGRIRGDASRGNRVVFGDYGLQAVQGGWVSARRSRPGASRRSNTCAPKAGFISAYSPTNPSPPSPWKPAWARARESRSIGRRWLSRDGVVRDRRGFRGGVADVFRPFGPQNAGEGAIPPPPGDVRQFMRSRAMTKASELREMSDEQMALLLKETKEHSSASACRRRPSGWTPPANSANSGG